MVKTAIESKVLIGQLLVQRGAAKQEHIAEALDKQQAERHSKLLGEILVELGYCTEDDVASALAESYGVPYAKVRPKICDVKVMEVLTRAFMEDHLVLPLFRVHNTLTVAVSEPANLFLVDEIEQITGHKVQVVCTTAKDIQATLRAYSPSANVFVTDECIEEQGLDDFELVEHASQDLNELKEAASQASIIELVHHLLREGVREQASDIHIEPDDQWLRVRYRVDGKLFEKTRPPLQMHEAIVSRIKMMAEMDVAERHHMQEGAIRVLVEERTITMRVTILPSNCGEKVAVRIVDPQRQLCNLESLGFTMGNLQRFRQIVQSVQGLILVTGPAGSGKHSTLHAVLNDINSDQVNVCTVEDPLVCNVSGVNQFEVGSWAPEGFSGCMQAVLRQNPDVLVASSLPDHDCAQYAVRAAMSGCLVLSTLHTSDDATSGVRRLLDLDIPPYLISDAVIGILSQRLVHKICPHCKKQTEPSPTMRQAIERIAEPVASYYHGVGCSQCRHTGFSGRIALHELLIPDGQIRHLIHDGIKEAGLRLHALKMGMVPLVNDGIEKVRAGIISLEEVLRTVPFDR